MGSRGLSKQILNKWPTVGRKLKLETFTLGDLALVNVDVTPEGGKVFVANAVAVDSQLHTVDSGSLKEVLKKVFPQLIYQSLNLPRIDILQVFISQMRNKCLSLKV